MRWLIVWKFVSRPPSQRWLTYGMPAASATSLTASRACFLVPTNSTVPPRWAISPANSLRLLEQRLRLEQVDDVDAAALAVDEAAHLGVPAARLVAEVDAGLQQLLDPDLGHGGAPLVGCVMQPGHEASRTRRRCAGQGRGLGGGVARGRGSDRRTVSASSRAPALEQCGPASLPLLRWSGPFLRAPRRSAAARSAGSGERDVDGRAGDRVGEGEPRGVQELALEPEAARACRTRDRRRPGGRSPAGGRGSGACARSPAARAAASSRGSARSISKCVTAARGSSVSVRHPGAHAPVAAERRVDRAACAPAGGPRRARGTRASISRALQRVAAAPRWTASSRATTSSPEVSRSRRCTIPGARRVLAAGRATGQRLGERPARGARAPGARRRPRACRRRAGARPRRRPRTARRRASARRRRPRARRRSTRSPPRSRGAWAARAPSTSTRPAVDQPLRARRASPAAPARKASSRSPGVLRRRVAARMARRARGRRAARARRSVIAMSATLNAGQRGSLMKSVTAPSRTRSMRLPSAPPSSSPVGSQTSGRVEVGGEEDEQRDERGADDDRRRPRRRREKRRRRRPSLRTWTSSTPGTTPSLLADGDVRAHERLRRLVEATTTTTATTARAQPRAGGRGINRGSG